MFARPRDLFAAGGRTRPLCSAASLMRTLPWGLTDSHDPFRLRDGTVSVMLNGSGRRHLNLVRRDLVSIPSG